MVQIFGHGFVFKNWLALHRFSDSVKTINKYFQEKKTHESQWDEFITKKINDGLQKIAMHFFYQNNDYCPHIFLSPDLQISKRKFSSSSFISSTNNGKNKFSFF